jgi:CRISPR-associated protein Csx3
MYDVIINESVKVMTTYKIDLKDDILQVGFGYSIAQNDQIVKDAATQLEEMARSGKLAGGQLLRINGPISIPVAFVLAHKLAHIYGAIGCFDPKLGKYVICITHNPAYNLGDLID